MLKVHVNVFINDNKTSMKLNILLPLRFRKIKLHNIILICTACISANFTENTRIKV